LDQATSQLLQLLFIVLKRQCGLIVVSSVGVFGRTRIYVGVTRVTGYSSECESSRELGVLLATSAGFGQDQADVVRRPGLYIMIIALELGI
jgi:hypothetical protein